jgi:hypothetical protein
MAERHIICLGLGLVLGSGVMFVATWAVVGCGCLKDSVHAGVIRMWLRCLVVCFYVGLGILFAGALGSIVENTMKGIR